MCRETAGQVRDKRALLLWVLAESSALLFVFYKIFAELFPPKRPLIYMVSREEALGARPGNFVYPAWVKTSAPIGPRGFRCRRRCKDLPRSCELVPAAARANQIMSSDVSTLWFWNVRFFKPQQEVRIPRAREPRGNRSPAQAQTSRIAGRAFAGARRRTNRRAKLSELTKLGMDLKPWDVLPEEANSNKAAETAWIGRSRGRKRGFRAKDAPVPARK